MRLWVPACSRLFLGNCLSPSHLHGLRRRVGTIFYKSLDPPPAENVTPHVLTARSIEDLHVAVKIYQS